MNQYPLWRYILVMMVVAIGAIYALPNVYVADPSLQVSARRSEPVDATLKDRVGLELTEAGIAFKRIELEQNRLLIRFDDRETREDGRPFVEQALGEQGYIVALNTAPAIPNWLRSVGGKPMYMGLDLRGGVHFLMQVDMDAVRVQTEDRFISDLRGSFREGKARYRSVSRDPQGGIRVNFLDETMKRQGVSIIKTDFPDLEAQELLSSSEIHVTVSETLLDETRRNALQQNLTTLRNRANEYGVSEPAIYQQGASRIVVQLPGVEDTAEAKKILGATATLEFRMVDLDGDPQAAAEGRIPVNSALYYDRVGNPVLLAKRVMLTGEYITGASSGIEQQTGAPAVFITLDGKGARMFSQATREQIGKPMGVVYIEQRKGRAEEEVINVATIRDELSRRFQISGLDSTEEARTLALLLRAGSLAAPIEIVEERTVGPSLGQQNIDRGLNSVLLGFFAVLVFMAFYYKLFGLVADMALALNLVLIVALLSMLQATLTLPGIAGIVLTVGMAVDANVLIFERIREELRNGNSPQMSIHAGYEKAFSTIADANITTLIAAIVLYQFGSGPIKGFAVTLSLGIATSMFTAIIGTRAVVNLVFGRRRVSKLVI